MIGPLARCTILCLTRCHGEGGVATCPHGRVPLWLNDSLPAPLAGKTPRSSLPLPPPGCPSCFVWAGSIFNEAVASLCSRAKASEPRGANRINAASRFPSPVSRWFSFRGARERMRALPWSRSTERSCPRPERAGAFVGPPTLALITRSPFHYSAAVFNYAQYIPLIDRVPVGPLLIVALTHKCEVDGEGRGAPK
ncbi:hypothetical protein SKAU_G00398600 [Synaphobranchus kaupii]|uniref:Uncharacterized protein n=1 Tax=Synaphobranchus kaupii TaxID=118154 RepID=A0A9Q1E8J7_SYNKA|nr:hypothetical protein SKAU_G00398600 [Synaphobranchus kaupii]